MPVSQIIQASLASGVPTSVARSALPTGSVLQVVQGSNSSTATSTNNTTWVSTHLSATITPTSSSSKILIIGQHSSARTVNATNGMQLRITKNSSALVTIASEYLFNTRDVDVALPFQYLDSPSTTSSLTYATEFRQLTGNGGQSQLNANSNPAFITLLEISA